MRFSKSRFSAVLVAAVAICMAGVCTAFELPTMPSPYLLPHFTGKILPTPQQVEYSDRAVSLEHAGVLLGDGIAADDGRVRELRGRIEAYGGTLQIVKAPDETAGTLILLGKSPLATKLLGDKTPPDRPEGYLIQPVEHAGRMVICLQGHDDAGLLWAVVSLNQLITSEAGKPVVYPAAVSDYPAMAGRVFIGTSLTEANIHHAVNFKYNRLMFTYPPGYRVNHPPLYWRAPYTEEQKAAIRAAGEYLNPLGIEWYFGGNIVSLKSEHQIHCKSEEDFRIIFEQAEVCLAAGGNIQVLFDDFRFPLSADDQRDFGTAREADIYFLNKLYAAMQEKRPGSKLLFCPPFYWGPDSPSLYPENRDEYLYAIGERVLPEIGIWWTGRRVKCTQVTPEATEWLTSRIKRRPWYWQNACGAFKHPYHYHYYTDPVDWPSFFYPGLFESLEGFALNGGNTHYLRGAVTLADYLWHPEAYAPETSIKETAMKLYGVATWPALVELDARLSYFDQYEFKQSPLVAANFAEIEAELEKLNAAFKAVQETCPGFKSSFVRSVRGWCARMKRNPLLKQYAERGAIARKQAESEIKLYPEDIFIAANEFTSGRQEYYGLNCARRYQVTLFGEQSQYPQTTARFEVEPFPSDCDYRLILSGQDNDGPGWAGTVKRCQIRISVNGHEVFAGENPFARRGWSQHEFVLPGQELERSSQLKIENIEPGAAENAPPWVMINYAVVRKATAPPLEQISGAAAPDDNTKAVSEATVTAQPVLSEEPVWRYDGIKGIEGLTSGDLTGDGLSDLVVVGADDAGRAVFIFHRNADGTFAGAPDRRLDLADARAWHPLIGDFDGDGKADIAMMILSKGMRVFFGRDDYAEPVNSMNINQHSGCTPLLYGSLGKNTRDFLIGPVLRRFNGENIFWPGYFYGPGINNNQSAAWGDLDNDGTLDIVFSTNKGGLRIYYGPFASLETYVKDLSQYVELDSPWSAMQYISDLNGDGRLDIAMLGVIREEETRRREVVMFFQNSPQGFNGIKAPGHVIRMTDAAGLFRIADWNKDGLDDIILFVGPELRLFLQKAQDGWPADDKTPDIRRRLPWRILQIHVADITGNGYPDVLAAGAKSLALYESRVAQH